MLCFQVYNNIQSFMKFKMCDRSFSLDNGWCMYIKSYVSGQLIRETARNQQNLSAEYLLSGHVFACVLHQACRKEFSRGGGVVCVFVFVDTGLCNNMI